MDPKNTAAPQCLVCKVTSANLPLVMLEYQGSRLWICPQHMPVLIHNPTELAGLLDGAEGMSPADHHD